MNPIPSRLRIICRSAQHDIHTYAQSHMLLLLCTKLSSIEGCLPSKVVFHQRSSSLKGCLPSKAVFHHRLSSIYCCSKVVFHHMSKHFEIFLGGTPILAPRSAIYPKMTTPALPMTLFFFLQNTCLL